MSKKSQDSEMSGWAGWAAFAGILAIVAGSFQMIAGLVALFKDDVYLVGPANVWLFDLTTWGWGLLLWGAFLILTGGAILSGKTWGRVVGVVLSSVSIIVNFAFIPVYPVWSIAMVTIGVLVVYALTVHGDELKVEE
ncbi:MAG: hypothetical protein MUF85_02370 [Patescibacteria group bacterium]|jgi:hypothetical protein|nr:hypothetical protein [Patescibacteria group bacterium]